MADILHGLSGHKAHAPLSSSQTLAISHHLYELNQDGLRQIQELRSASQSVNGVIATLKKDLAHSQSSISSLNDELNLLRSQQQVISRDVAEDAALGARLKAGLNKACAGLDQLREGQKFTNTNLHIVREDVKIQAADLENLRADFGNILKGRLSACEQKLNEAMLGLQALKTDHDQTKVRVGDHTSRLHELAATDKAAKEERKAFSMALARQGKSLADLADKCGKDRSNLEMTNEVVKKLSEIIDATKSSVKNLQTDCKSLEGKHGCLDNDHSKTAKMANTVREDLCKVVASLDQTRNGLREVNDQIQALRDNSSNADASLQKLDSELKRAHHTLASTQEQLSATNSLVLPNLSADEFAPKGAASSMSSVQTAHKGFAWSAGSRNASFTASCSLSKVSPRKRIDQSLMASVMNAPDRMSYV